MANQITTYALLQTAVADWLLRTDLTSVIPSLIGLAEARLRRDKRVRRLAVNSAFTIDGASETLPTDFRSLDSLYLNGSGSRYGEIETVDLATLSEYQHRYQPTGVPRTCAVGVLPLAEDRATIYFAPVPDAAYTAVLGYWQGFADLSDANTSNWLLTSHPDIYLYGTLIESAPYMKDDERLPVWNTRFETALVELTQYNKQSAYGGSLVRRPTYRIP